MLENIILALLLNTSECRVNEVTVLTPYGVICLTKEQAINLRGLK